MLAPMKVERLLDAGEPHVEFRLRPRIERGERADDSRLALLNDEIRPGHEEHRRADYRCAQIAEHFSGIVHIDSRMYQGRRMNDAIVCCLWRRFFCWRENVILPHSPALPAVSRGGVRDAALCA